MADTAKKPETHTRSASGRSLRKLNPTLYKFEAVGDMIEGTLVGSRVHVFSNGPATKYTLRQEDDSLVVFFGATMLDGLMEAIEVGQFVQIVYLGKEETTAGQPLNVYDVAAEDVS